MTLSSSRHPSRFAAAVLALALAGGLSVAVPTAASAADLGAGPAPAPRAQAVQPLEAVDAVTVGYRDGALALGSATSAGEPVDPGSTLLAVPDVAAGATTHLSTTGLSGGLPAGAQLSDLVLTLVAVHGPDGGGFGLRGNGEGGESTVLLGTSGDSPTALALEQETRLATSWLFNAPGRFTLSLRADAVVTTDGASTPVSSPVVDYTIAVGPVATPTALELSSASSAESGAEVPLVATVEPAAAVGAVEFFDGETLLGHSPVVSGTADFSASGLPDGRHALHARFVPSWSTDFAESVSEPVAVRMGPPPQLRVVSSGALAVTPKVSGDGGVIADYELGLYDVSDQAAPQWFPATDVVLQLSSAERDEEAGTWSTRSAYTAPADIPPYLAGGRLLLSSQPSFQAAPTARVAWGGINSAYLGDLAANPSIVLAASSGPQGGSFRGIFGSDAIWNSATLDTGPAQSPLGVVRNGVQYLGWSFDREGVYCVTLQGSVTGKANGEILRHASYTVVVGDTVPAGLEACEQIDPAQPDPDPDPDPGSGTPWSVLDEGHTDVRAAVVAGELALGMSSALTPFDDVVLSGTPPSRRVEPPQPGADGTAIGPVGTKYWYFPTSPVKKPGSRTDDYLWPGFSTESLRNEQLLSPLTFSLDGFSLDGVANPPGVTVALLSPATNAQRSASSFNTRMGSPTSFERYTNSHGHPLWAFTAPGVYCLSLGVAAQLADGHWSRSDAQLTVVVGDAVDPATVTPCGRGEAQPSIADPRPVPTVSATGAHLLADDDATVELFADGGALRAVTSTAATVAEAPVYRDPEDVIASVAVFQQRYEAWRLTAGGVSSVGFDSDRLPSSALAPGTAITVALGEVRGPGRVEATNAFEVRTPGGLSSADPARRSFTLAPATSLSGLQWDFERPGVYCVPLSWTATLADGTVSTVVKTLTFAVGSTDVSSPDHLDRSAVTSCSRGQQATPAPGDGGQPDPDPSPDPDAPEWNVANGSTTRSGATVLNDGHVDIASVIEDGRFVTRVKDTTASADPVWRDPGTTVLQLFPETRTTVPDNPAFSFLGAPGRPIWAVDQTQVEGVLWPGWSTESLDPAATRGGVSWSLNRVEGMPDDDGRTSAVGQFAIYQTEGFGRPSVIFDTRDGVPDAYVIDKNVHAHGTWTFSEQGVYCLAMTRAALAADGSTLSDDFVLTIAVGEVDVPSIDPGRCFLGRAPAGNPGLDAPGEGGGTPNTAVLTTQERCEASGSVILSEGHIDVGTRIVDDGLQSLVKDGTRGGDPVWREPSSTVLWLKPASAVVSPGGSFAFLGAAGETVWQVPQTRAPELIWLGWNTEEVGGGRLASPVTWRLTSVEGPGTVTIYELGAFGDPRIVLREGGAYDIPLGVHAHGNWAFTAQGVYRLHFTQSAILPGGAVTSDSETLTIAVGDVDPTLLGSSGRCGIVPASLVVAPAPPPALSAAPVPPSSRGRADVAAGAQEAVIEPIAEEVPGWVVVLAVAGGVLLVCAAVVGATLVVRRRGTTPAP
ncbi:choice-of-anchor M domain-containing protein [Compostimonas suwonensis]|uniref:Putative ABC transporter-associated repeat protein n=1 Tax=Compostimonas suwonensis TaxID=1048394 RepID=A0A2M9BCP9_9MICO|nr:choice-of-anchor M domain-containing protein [Compostimonas suwonensis]PJJ55684.1 putative ABC transporter-associated repeat protein [Compostimonas suwonensis]